MSSKNEMHALQTASLSHTEYPRIHGLRLRLLLWYGGLVVIALLLFGVLVLSLTTDVLNQSVSTAVETEARLVVSQVEHELVARPGYWPEQLALPALNVYQEPGVVIEVIDTQGTRRYDSDRDPVSTIPFSLEARRAVAIGQSAQYAAAVEGGRVLVEAVPLRAPGGGNGGAATKTAGGAGTTNTGEVIGTVLVAKSLSDVDRTLFFVKTLLLISGLIVVAGALVGGWAIAARVLQPLAEIARTARTIAATTAQGTRLGNLSQRVRRPKGRDEMVQVVDAFNEMLTNLERATQTQRRFVADASHELRAPLTTIQGNLSFLQRHGDELPAEERRTMLRDAHAETLRLARLVEELLLLARADAQVDTAQRQEGAGEERREGAVVELDHVVLHLVRQLRGRLVAEESALKLEVGRIEPVRMYGDEEQVRRVILIVLDNALKYTPQTTEAGQGRVTVSLQRRGSEAVLQVHDTGIGIEPGELPHIFERFYRADRARSRQGTGLGLSIAQTLVEQLGGRISAESVVGKGSTFTIVFPVHE